MSEVKDLRVDGQRLWDSIMAIGEIGPGERAGGESGLGSSRPRARGIGRTTTPASGVALGGVRPAVAGSPAGRWAG